MVEQVGCYSSIVGPIFAEPEKVLRRPGNLRCQAPFVSQPHFPVDVILAGFVRARCRIDLLMFVEKTDARIAIVAGLGPGGLANSPLGDGFARLPKRVAGGPVWSNL